MDMREHDVKAHAETQYNFLMNVPSLKISTHNEEQEEPAAKNKNNSQRSYWTLQLVLKAHKLLYRAHRGSRWNNNNLPRCIHGSPQSMMTSQIQTNIS